MNEKIGICFETELYKDNTTFFLTSNMPESIWRSTTYKGFCCQYFVIWNKIICFAVAMSNLIHDVQTSYAKENCSFTDINRI